MDDLTPTQWAVVIAVGVASIFGPQLFSKKPQAQCGGVVGVPRYGRPTRGYNPLSVLWGVLKMLVCFALFAAISVGIYADLAVHVNEDAHWFILFMVFILDLMVMGGLLRLLLPPAYWAYMQAKPEKVHNGTDWMVGIVLTLAWLPMVGLQLLAMTGSRG